MSPSSQPALIKPARQQVDFRALEVVGLAQHLAGPGAGRHDHRHALGRLSELVGDPVGRMAAAGALHHDPPVARIQRLLDQPAVVAERHRQQRDRRDLGVAGHGDRVAGAGAAGEPHRAFREPAEQPQRARAEGRGVRRLRLLHEARGVDLVVHDDHDAETARRPVGCEAHGVEQVGRSVRAGERRVAHGSGHDHRGIEREDAVQHEGRLLHRVGAVSHHRPVGAVGHRLLDGVRQREQVAERDLGARQQAEGLGLDRRHLAELRHRLHQRCGIQRGGDTPLPAARHGDGPAHGEDRDARQHGLCLSRAARSRTRPGSWSSPGART